MIVVTVVVDLLHLHLDRMRNDLLRNILLLIGIFRLIRLRNEMIIPQEKLGILLGDLVRDTMIAPSLGGLLWMTMEGAIDETI